VWNRAEFMTPSSVGKGKKGGAKGIGKCVGEITGVLKNQKEKKGKEDKVSNYLCRESEFRKKYNYVYLQKKKK